MKKLIAIRLPIDIDERLMRLAKTTGRTKTWYAREAIMRYIEDMEDTYIAIDRLENPARRITGAEAELELLENQ
jgi:RHH-type rel operon transcriptional repressor/antitoxin RelB